MRSFEERWHLKGKTALVTGASRGIGKATAEELLRFGAEVLIVARKSEDIAEVVSGCGAEGLKAHGLAADMSSAEGRQKVIAEVGRLWHGKLDILVNNVGTNIRKATLDYSADEVESLFATNLASVFETCRGLYPALRASGSGAIVNISSVAGSWVITTGAPYAMTKAALEHLTRYLAVEWAADGIRVNAVAPGYIETPLTETVLGKPSFRAKVLDHTPVKRLGRPNDIAAAVAFLCMPAASFITGTVTTADGGFSALGFDFARHIKDENGVSPLF